MGGPPWGQKDTPGKTFWHTRGWGGVQACKKEDGAQGDLGVDVGGMGESGGLDWAQGGFGGWEMGAVK